MAKGFTLDWYKELGWRANPFEDKVLQPITYYLSGYEEARHQINYYLIERDQFGTITGDKGMGKTALLQWIQKELKKYRRRTIAHYTTGAELDPQTFLHGLVRSATSLPLYWGLHAYYGLSLDKAVAWVRERIGNPDHAFHFTQHIYRRDYRDLLKVKTFLQEQLEDRTILYLIDDAGDLPPKTESLIKELFQASIPLQVILAGTKEDLKGKHGQHFGTKDSLKIHLKSLSYAHARELIKKRITAVGGEDIWPLDDHTLSELWKQAENPKTLLKLCYDWTVKQTLKGLRKQKQTAIEPMAEESFPLPETVREAEEEEEYKIKVKGSDEVIVKK